MDPDTLALLGSFVSGMGAVLSGFLGIRFERKRSAEDCERRLQALREGFEMRNRVGE